MASSVIVVRLTSDLTNDCSQTLGYPRVLGPSHLLGLAESRRSSRKSEAQLRRLSENRTTSPTLREGDLLVANLLPVSKLIHQFSIIVYEDGRFESSERLYGTPDSNSIYHKESGDLEPEKLAILRGLLQGYAEIAKAVEEFVSSNDVDPFEFESKDRRGLGFFADSEERGISTWMLNYYSSHFERPEVQKMFNAIESPARAG